MMGAEANYISAEIYVLGHTMQIEHSLLLYNDGRRVLVIEGGDLTRTLGYLESQSFQFNSIVRLESQYEISF